MADPMVWLSGKERNSATGSSSSTLIDAKLEEHQIGGTKPCPRCGFKLDSKEGIQDWPGLPAGVKFDPTDQELLEHLEAKAEICGTKPHPLIDEFIPTLEGEDGICYTHPEKLPGVTRDGLNRHFFHRPSKAYTTGTRKRRKIQGECDLQGGETRWHKTGKTRPVIVNGKQKGCKKILVLYTNFGKHRKPEKTNWVMHQYHLGLQEEEKDGELVVSKVFYQTQPRQCNWERNANDLVEGNKSQESMTDMFRPADSGRLVKSLYTANNTPGLAAVAVATPSVAYNVVGDVQEVKTDQFSHARTSFDEGISDSGKGSESSHCTPRSCDEHEEHEQQQQKKNNLHDDTAQGFRMTRHDISSIMRLNNNSSSNNNNNNNNTNNNIRSDANVEHQASFHSHPPPSPAHHHRSSTPDMACRAGESQDPEIHEEDLAALEDKLIPNEKIQTTRQPKTASRSSLHKLSLDDIFIDTTEMKEETAVPFTNSQEPEWFKYSTFWTESDSLEHQKMI